MTSAGAKMEEVQVCVALALPPEPSSSADGAWLFYSGTRSIEYMYIRRAHHRSCHTLIPIVVLTLDLLQ